MGSKRARDKGKAASNARAKYLVDQREISNAPTTNTANPTRDRPQKQTQIARATFQRGNRQRGSVESVPLTAEKQCIKQWCAETTGKAFRQHRKDFYSTLRKYLPDGPMEAFNDPNNTHKNRYDDVELYDKTRVVIKNPNDDYIHASWVKITSEVRYICTQGPLENTVAQFWAMCIQENCKVIVQLCCNEEDGVAKCASYFKAGGTEKYEGISVTAGDPRGGAGMTKVDITQLKAKANGKEKEVQHILFKGWPDHGVPDSVKTVLQIRETARKIAGDTPIIIHCSAGVGRTGSFVAMDMIHHKLTKDRTADFKVDSIVRNLREQRRYAIQTDFQYVFVIRCILELAHQAAIPPNEDMKRFTDDYNSLMARRKK